MNGLIKVTCTGLVVAMSAVGCTVTDNGAVIPAGQDASATRDVYAPTHGSDSNQMVNPPVTYHRSTTPYSYHNQPDRTHTTPADRRTSVPSALSGGNSGGQPTDNSTVTNRQPANNGGTTGNTTRVENRNSGGSLAHGDPAADESTTPTRRSPITPPITTAPMDGRTAARTSSNNMQQITFTRVGADFDVDIDPTGKYLIYASTRNSDTADIYIKGTKSPTMTQFTQNPANDVMPAFSPDGRWIAFASDRTGNWDICLKNVSGNRAIQLTNGASHELHPTWHPNGKQIVFSALNEQSGDWEMVIVDVDKPNNRKFIGKGLFPEFSPSGKKLLYQRSRERGSRLFGVWTLDLINGEGIHPTEIVAARNSALITPTWSHDGSRISFVSVVNPPADPDERPANTSIWVCNVDGTNKVNMTNDRYVNLQPAWGEGDMLYFISNRTGNDNVWGIRPNKGLGCTRRTRNSFRTCSTEARRQYLGG